jgi:GYF domain 2
MFRRTPKVISRLAGAPSTDNFEELLRQNLKLRQELGAALAKAQPEWHMSRGGLQFGPYSAADLSAMAEVGMLRADDFLWKPGFDTWKPASDLHGTSRALRIEAFATASGAVRRQTYVSALPQVAKRVPLRLSFSKRSPEFLSEL